MTVVMTVYHGFDALQTVVTISIASAGTGRHLSYPLARALHGRPIDPVRPHTTGLTGQHRYRAAGLPRGLQIDRTGVITGRAQRAGGSGVTVTVTGTNGSASTKVTIQVTRDPTYHPPTPQPPTPRPEPPLPPGLGAKDIPLPPA